MLLSMAAHYHYDAAKAAKALGGLFTETPRAGDSSLLTTIAGTIELLAMRQQRGETDLGDPDWQLNLCLDPLEATVIWPSLVRTPASGFSTISMAGPSHRPAVRR